MPILPVHVCLADCPHATSVYRTPPRRNLRAARDAAAFFAVGHLAMGLHETLMAPVAPLTVWTGLAQDDPRQARRIPPPARAAAAAVSLPLCLALGVGHMASSPLIGLWAGCREWQTPGWFAYDFSDASRRA